MKLYSHMVYVNRLRLSVLEKDVNTQKEMIDSLRKSKEDLLSSISRQSLKRLSLIYYRIVIPNLRLNETNEFQDDLAQRRFLREHKGDPQNLLSHLKMRFCIRACFQT